MYSQSRCTPINEIVCSLFFELKIPRDLQSLSKNFSKNDSFLAFEGLISYKQCKWQVLFECISGIKPAQLKWLSIFTSRTCIIIYNLCHVFEM